MASKNTGKEPTPVERRERRLRCVSQAITLCTGTSDIAKIILFIWQNWPF